MSTLKVNSRNTELKGKQLRKSGIIPAIIYGKNLDHSISIQLDEPAAFRLIKGHGIGSQIEISLDGETYSTMLKEITFTPLDNRIEHLDFQALTAGETVKVHVHLNIIGKTNVETGGIVNELINEIEIECLPKDLVEHIDVDVSNMKIGASLQVSDLPIASNEAYHIITATDTAVVQVSLPNAAAETTEGDEGSAEVPLIGSKDE